MLTHPTLPVLLIILLAGIILPDLFRKLKLPFISTLILLGALVGPKGLGYVQLDETISFFGFLGATFLMLLAGLQLRETHLTSLDHRVFKLALLNGIIPFLVGAGIVRWFGFDWLATLLVGTIFASSSIAIIAAAVTGARLLKRPVGKDLLAMAILEDVSSLVVLSLLLQSVSPITQFPLPIYFGILVSSVVVLRMFLPELARYYFHHLPKKDTYEGRVRFVLVALIATLLYFAGLGVHPILAAFLVGALLADAVGSEELYEKVHTIGYGLFVPVFFFIVGMEMDLNMLFAFDIRNVLLLSIILGSILAKSLSGYFGGRWLGFTRRDSRLFGVASTAQLTTTLAVTYAATELQILPPVLVTSIIVLSMVTTLLMPVIFNLFARSHYA